MAASIALYGDSGSGKTTQAGELAKYVKKNRGATTVLYTADMGGYDSIRPLVRLGVVRPVELGPDDNAWVWVDDACSGKTLLPTDGLAIFDSGTSISEALLMACAKSPNQIGQQKTQRFGVTNQDGKVLSVNINNEAHYGIVQGFLLDAIWKSTWLTRKGVDVLWTFSVHRGEEQDRTPILGPKLAGKALTAAIPKWFRYTFRIASIPQEGAEPVHRLYLTEYPELAGLGHSFGNARYPLGASPLPPYIEPASIPAALQLIEKGHEEADAALAEELGL